MASRITAAAAGFTAVVALTGVAAPSTTGSAQAATPVRQAPTSGTSGWTTVADYRMNERSGRVLHDSSSNHLDGVIGGDVRLTGTYFRFPHVRPRTYRPEHPAFVDSAMFNPALASFRVTWRFRVSPELPPVFRPNFVQKGQGWPSGGMFKLMNHDGRVGCMFRDGAARQATVSTATSFSDGEWHVATCARMLGPDPRVVVRVDGRLLGVRHAYVGRIANSWLLAIGGNTRCNGNQGDEPQHCNYWQGDMAWLRVQTQPPLEPPPIVPPTTPPTSG